VKKFKYLSIQTSNEVVEVPIYNASSRGESFPLHKTLVSNFCRNNCKYCAFRKERRIRREEIAPEELAKISYYLWRKGVIKGVFYSSSIRDPEEDSERVVRTAEYLRALGYSGYIHLKLMPGCSKDVIRRACKVADRAGFNVESSPGFFEDLCPDIDLKRDILKRFKWMREEMKKSERMKSGMDTQFVLGANEETDYEVASFTEMLYKKFGLRRIYYSPFKPVKDTPLENNPPCSKTREIRMYQLSFLLRDYGMSLRDLDICFDERGFLKNGDPKRIYFEEFKDDILVDLKEASIKDLMRLPGIGMKRARKIIEWRRRREIRDWRDFSKASGLSDEWRRILEPHLVFDERQTRIPEWVR
jgi:predicted DNA-binding helix-hairpin-helix protein